MSSESLFRWICLCALVLSISISGYYRWKARQDGEAISRRAEEGKLIALRLLVTMPLLVAIFAYLARPSWISWARLDLPEWLRWVGAAMMIGTAPVVAWVMRSIGRNISETVLTKESHELVTTGPYRWVRHPLYSSGLVLLMGLALLSANAFIAALVLVILLVIVIVIIPREEDALIDIFGTSYESYQSRTGRLMPALHRNIPSKSWNQEML